MSIAWSTMVTVTLLCEPETDEFEERFVATTMGGTPRNAIVTVEDSESGAAALSNLRAALREMGFDGRLFVYDVSEPGTAREYEA